MEKVIKGDIVYTDNSKELKPVTGMFGSFDPAGNLVISFYNEHVTLPNQYRLTLDNDLSAEEFFNSDNLSSITREVVSTIVMNKETAESLKNWLELKVTENKEV